MFRTTRALFAAKRLSIAKSTVAPYSKVLQEFLGAPGITVGNATRMVYRDNNLNRGDDIVKCDDNLKKLFYGKEIVTGKDVAKLVRQHFDAVEYIKCTSKIAEKCAENPSAFEPQDWTVQYLMSNWGDNIVIITVDALSKEKERFYSCGGYITINGVRKAWFRSIFHKMSNQNYAETHAQVLGLVVASELNFQGKRVLRADATNALRMTSIVCKAFSKKVSPILSSEELGSVGHLYRDLEQIDHGYQLEVIHIKKEFNVLADAITRDVYEKDGKTVRKQEHVVVHGDLPQDYNVVKAIQR